MGDAWADFASETPALLGTVAHFTKPAPIKHENHKR